MRTRIWLNAIDYLGRTKGEYPFESATEAMTKAADLIGWPDTIVYVYDADNEGSYHPGTPVARISKESGYVSLPESF